MTGNRARAQRSGLSAIALATADDRNRNRFSSIPMPDIDSDPDNRSVCITRSRKGGRKKSVSVFGIGTHYRTKLNKYKNNIEKRYRSRPDNRKKSPLAKAQRAQRGKKYCTELRKFEICGLCILSVQLYYPVHKNFRIS